MRSQIAKFWLLFFLCDIIDLVINMVISSPGNNFFKDLMKLKQKKYRLQTNQFLVEGLHLVKEAIACGLCLEVISKDKVTFWNKDTVVLSESLLRLLSDVEEPQDIFALCQMRTDFSLGNRILLLDGIQDPGNLGTLLRSAKAFGFETVIFENTVDLYNSKVIRSTQGAIFLMTCRQAVLSSFMKEHREYHYIGTDVKLGTPLNEAKISSEKIGLLLGNEAQGVRKELMDLTQSSVTIEMGGMESINVGVAGGIIMYRFRGKK